MRMITNKKMRAILQLIENANIEELSGVNQIEFDRLLNLPMKRVKDCLIFSEKTKEELENSFETVMKKRFGDKTGYEVCLTETRINSFFESEISVETALRIALLVIPAWKKKINDIFPDAQVCFIIGSDGSNVDIRFHLIRKNELPWLSADIERYREAVGYIQY